MKCSVKTCKRKAAYALTGSLKLKNEWIRVAYVLCKKHDKIHDIVYPLRGIAH